MNVQTFYTIWYIFLVSNLVQKKKKHEHQLTTYCEFWTFPLILLFGISLCMIRLSDEDDF